MSGSAHGDFWDACYPASGCIYWGTYEIAGREGTWTGPWSGTDDALLGLGSFLIVLQGTGAYEGWTFVTHWQDTFTGEATFSGLIYPGGPPPWPAEVTQSPAP